MDFSEYDLPTQASDLERRKAIIDALQANAAKGTSLGDAVRGMFGGAPRDGKAEMESYARDSMAHQQRYQNQMGQELGSYMDRMQGAPARPPSPDFEGNAVGPAVPAQAPNPREAIVRAMTSQLPEMQAMGKASMSAFGKPHDLKEHVIGDTLVTTDGQGHTVGSQQFNKADWGSVEQMGTGQDGKPLFGQRNTRTGEVKYAPAGQTINIDNKGMSEVQKETIPVLKAARDTVTGAQQGLQAAQRVMQLVDDPQVQTGFGASVANGLGALGAQLGFNGPEGVAKTQALATEMAAKTLSMTKQLTGAISDKEKPFLEQVVAGKIDFTPQVIKHVAALTFQMNHNAIMNATDQYQTAKTVPGMEGAEKLFPLPPLSWDHPQRNGKDDPALQLDRNSRMQYDGSYLSGGTPSRRASDATAPRRRISVQEFLQGGQ